MGMKKQLRPPLEEFIAYLDDYEGLVIPADEAGNQTAIGTVIVIGAGSAALAERVRHLLALSDPFLDKLEPGEPFFVLGGRDVTAELLVRAWAAGAEASADPVKVAEARATADRMAVYPGRRLPT